MGMRSPDVEFHVTGWFAVIFIIVFVAMAIPNIWWLVGKIF